jgi:hypothetical protein
MGIIVTVPLSSLCVYDAIAISFSLQKYTDTELMSYKLFIHQNIVENMEQLCLACCEMFPDDPIIQTEAFKTLYPDDVLHMDQYRSTQIIE